jgi:hypothetical protein
VPRTVSAYKARMRQPAMPIPELVEILISLSHILAKYTGPLYLNL